MNSPLMTVKRIKVDLVVPDGGHFIVDVYTPNDEENKFSLDILYLVTEWLGEVVAQGSVEVTGQ